MWTAGGVRSVTRMHRHRHHARHHRIGDEERERASTELRARYRDGLIDRDELVARLDRVWAASWAADLRRAVGPGPLRPGAGRAAGPR